MDEAARDRREAAHKSLDWLLDQLDQFSPDAEFAPFHAANLVKTAAYHVALTCGPEMIRIAYGEIANPSDRSEVLAALCRRMQIAQSLFDLTRRDHAAGSLSHAAEEARAISMGDVPTLFAPLDGRRVQVRVVLAKAEALWWSEYLEARQVPLFERQALISTAFGHPWDTISRWSKQIEDVLGNGWLSNKLHSAKRSGQSQEITEQTTPWEPDQDGDFKGFELAVASGDLNNSAWWRSELKSAGNRYKAAMGFSVVSAPISDP